MTYSVRNIAIALVLAAIAAVLVIYYTQGVQNKADQGSQSVNVVVATQTIPTGTSVKSVMSDFAVRSVVRKDMVVGALTSLSQLDAANTTSTQIIQGSQVTGAMFGANASNPIASQISGPTRAMQVAFNPNMVLGGTLAAGDHVDVAWEGNIQPANNSSKFSEVTVSRIILRNIQVLSTPATGVASTALTSDSSGGGGGNNGQNGTAVILAIPDTEAPFFLQAYANGQIWFLLRPKTGAQDGPSTIANACQMIAAGLTKSQVRQAVPFC